MVLRPPPVRETDQTCVVVGALRISADVMKGELAMYQQLVSPLSQAILEPLRFPGS